MIFDSKAKLNRIGLSAKNSDAVYTHNLALKLYKEFISFYRNGSQKRF
jgi:hypothetical protein